MATTPTPSAGSGYSITGSSITQAATQLGEQAVMTKAVTSKVQAPTVGPATGSPVAAAAWTLFQTILQLEINQLATGLTGDTAAINAIVQNYSQMESGASTAMNQTTNLLGPVANPTPAGSATPAPAPTPTPAAGK